MYDYLRIMAMLFVIITHSIQADLSQNLVEGAGETYIMTAIYWFCLVCNPIYVMLSGALLLPYKDEKFSRFYLRRFSRVVIPMFVYYFFYVWGDYRATMKMGDVVKTTVKNFVQGSTPESPHYWLIYTILCIYILVPFLRDMCKNISYKALTILVILSCIFMCNGTLFTVTFAISYYFNPWLCVAIMGYWLSRPETRKYDKALMVLGACGLVIGLWMIYIGEDFAAKCCNTSPVMLFIAMGLFAMVCKAKIFSRGNWIVKMISKYSFPMILVHWAGLYLVVRGKLNIYAVNYHGLGIIISLLANVVVDFVLAFLIDNMIVRAFSTAFDLMINVLRKGVDSASKALTGK
jgi:surface polysaccharide O-acyltransferase-like enzyme